MDTIWVIIGKIALIAGVLLTILQIVRILRPKKPKLIATIRPCEFKWPSFISKHEDGLRTLCSWETHQTIVQGLEYDASKKVLEQLEKHLKRVDQHEYTMALIKHRGMWSVLVSNNSADSCEDVRLKIPSCQSAYISKDGSSLSIDKPTEVLSLGDIRPKESVSVVAWVETGVAEWQVNTITLNHKTGAEVIKGIYPTPRWAYDLSRNWVQMLWLCIQFLLIWTVIIIAAAQTMGENRALRKQSVSAVKPTISSTNGVADLPKP